MKEVGRLPAPKAWSICRLDATGLLDLGHVDSSNYKVMLNNKELARDLAKTEPPTVLPFPNRYEKNGDKNHHYEEQLRAYNTNHSEVHRYSRIQWHLERTPLDYLPIYEEELVFTGYGRGQSSVTMNFKADDGQELSFGPSGIADLISAILDGKSLVVGGKLKVRFTFAKRGANVYAEVHYQ